MGQATLVLLAICLAIVQTEAIWSLFDKSSGAREFDLINQHLVESVDSDDAELNFAAAAEWLKEKQASGKKQKLIRALESFIGLASVVDKEKCNQEGFKILQACNEGTRGQAILGLEPIRRIDRLVRKYALEHAALCFSVYPGSMARKKRKLGMRVEDKVELIRTANRRIRHFGGELRDADNQEYDEFDLRTESDVLADLKVLGSIEKSGSHDPEARKYLKKVADIEKGAYVVEEKKVRELFDKYVYQPCKEYDEKVARDLYDSMAFDLHVTYSTKVGEASSQIIGDKIGMSICTHIVHDTKLRESTVRRLLKSIKSTK